MVETTDPQSFDDFTSLIMTPSEGADEAEAPAEVQTTTSEEPAAEAVAEQEPEAEPVEAEAEEVEQTDAAEVAQETENTVETLEEPLYSVKVDGEVRDVTLDELMRGYSGQEYVQKGMKTAAAIKQEAENAYEVLQSELKAVQRLRQRMESGDVIAEPPAPNPENFQNDPLGYMEAKMEHDAKMEAYKADTSRLSKLEQAEQVRMEKAHKAYLAQQMDILTKRIPDLADPEKAPALQSRMVKAGQSYYGFSEQELRGQGDARQIAVLHDAMRYRELQAAGQTVKPNKPKPVIKPGTARTEVSSKAKQRQKVKARMQKNGDMNSVIDFLTS